MIAARQLCYRGSVRYTRQTAILVSGSVMPYYKRSSAYVDLATVHMLRLTAGVSPSEADLEDCDQYEWMVKVDGARDAQIAGDGKWAGILEYERAPEDPDSIFAPGLVGRVLQSFVAIRIEGAEGLLGDSLSNCDHEIVLDCFDDLQELGEQALAETAKREKRERVELLGPGAEEEETPKDTDEWFPVAFLSRYSYGDGWETDDDISFEVLGSPVGILVAVGVDAAPQARSYGTGPALQDRETAARVTAELLDTRPALLPEGEVPKVPGLWWAYPTKANEAHRRWGGVELILPDENARFLGDRPKDALMIRDRGWADQYTRNLGVRWYGPVPQPPPIPGVVQKGCDWVEKIL